MRPWISPLLLGVGLTAGMAAPAAADTLTPRSPVIVRNSHIPAPFQRHHFRHSHPGFLHSHPGVDPLFFGVPLVYSGDYVAGGVASGMPPVMMLSEPPGTAPPPPQLPAIEQRPTVETTPEGVAIVRGPGSHHIGY